MADLEAVLAKLVSENKAARERFEGVASRTVSAIMRGDSDGLNNIVRQLASDEEAGESSAEPLEDGNPDGTAGA